MEEEQKIIEDQSGMNQGNQITIEDVLESTGPGFKVNFITFLNENNVILLI